MKKILEAKKKTEEETYEKRKRGNMRSRVNATQIGGEVRGKEKSSKRKGREKTSR